MNPKRSSRLNFPEQRIAGQTLAYLAGRVVRGKIRRDDSFFLLVGPSGCGKTRLLRALFKKVVSHKNGATARTVQMGNAREILSHWRESEIRDREGTSALRRQIVDLDLLILEDIQQLKKNETEYLARLMDERNVHRKATVFSSTRYPQKLDRLDTAFRSRLNSSLLIEMEPLGLDSKKVYLASRLDSLGLELEPRMLEWLSQKVEGSIRRMQSLCNRIVQESISVKRHPTLEDLAKLVHEIRPMGKAISMENITIQVGKAFSVNPKSMVMRKRNKESLLPRQVGMYIARKMTGMSLGEIGAFFGGRNHATVSHALRKVEKALRKDHALSGTIKQLENDLS